MKEWIIPVVIAIIWILNAVLRNRDNEEPVRVARGKLGERPDGRSPTSDIDRFLQEIEKMKQKSAEPTATPPKARQVPKVRPVPQGPPRVRPVMPRSKSPSLEEVLPVIVTEQPISTPIAPTLRSQPASAAPKSPRRTASPALMGLIRQLRSPQSAVNAIVMSEILSPPKSMRR
jgi:hypothetical protein